MGLRWSCISYVAFAYESPNVQAILGCNGVIVNSSMNLNNSNFFVSSIQDEAQFLFHM